MTKSILKINNLDVSIKGKLVLSGINLNIKEGEVHVLFGPNGSGKTSLLSAIMSLPGYKTKNGEIWFKGHKIQNQSTDKIANLGIGTAFQRPPAIEGVRIIDFLNAIGSDSDTKEELKKLDLNEFKEREINVGFSGGEIKRWEIMKLYKQNPQLILLDEPESGVDLQHIKTIGHEINKLLKVDPKRSALIITHVGLILKYVKAHKGHLINNGKILKSGDPKQLFRYIQHHGYNKK